mgnify:FL=1
MEVILAIDLKEGVMVKAFAGFRLNYKPFKSSSYDYQNPCNFIKKVLINFPLTKVYIADLDSIQKNGSNLKIVINLLKEFPSLVFLIDCGFDYPISVKKYIKRLSDENVKNFRIILGTESLKNFNLHNFDFKRNFYLSIDFNGRESKWIQKFKRNNFKMNLILMFLKNTGGRGINYDYIKSLRHLLKKHNVYYAGGVKYWNQLRSLERLGFYGAIVLSLLVKKIQGTN